MSDVLSDTGKYTLLPGAREKLAKKHRGDEYNQRL